MTAVVADTHAAVWYLLVSLRLSQRALEAFDGAARSGDAIFVASISLVEVTYLVEKQRLPEVALERLSNALRSTTIGLEVAPLDQGIADTLRRIPRDIVPDMPDRIVAATALHLNLPLVTLDRQIQAAGINTIW